MSKIACCSKKVDYNILYCGTDPDGNSANNKEVKVVNYWSRKKFLINVDTSNEPDKKIFIYDSEKAVGIDPNLNLDLSKISRNDGTGPTGLYNGIKLVINYVIDKIPFGNFDINYTNQSPIQSPIQINGNDYEAILNIRTSQRAKEPDIVVDDGICDCIGKSQYKKTYEINDSNNDIKISIDGGNTWIQVLIPKGVVIPAGKDVLFELLKEKITDAIKSTGKFDPDIVFLDVGGLTDGFKIKIIKPLGGLSCSKFKIKSETGGLGFILNKIYDMTNPIGKCYIESEVINPYSADLYYCTIRILKYYIITIMHEFMHFLGFTHTHQIINQGNNLEFIIEKLKEMVKKNAPLIDDLVLQREINVQYLNKNYITKQNFNNASIMNYQIDKCYLSQGEATPKYFGLSGTDLENLKTNYGRRQSIENYKYKKKSYHKYLFLTIILILLILLIIFIL